MRLLLILIALTTQAHAQTNSPHHIDLSMTKEQIKCLQETGKFCPMASPSPSPSASPVGH